MRIGIDANAYYKDMTGTGVYIRNIIDRWRKESKQLFLFANNRKSVLDSARKKNVFARLLNGLMDIYWTQIVLPLELKRNRIDVLFSPSFVCPLFSPCPLAITVLDMTFRRYPETVDRLYKYYLEAIIPFIKKKAAAILTISNFSKEEIVSLLKIPSDKVKVVYLGGRDVFSEEDDRSNNGKLKSKYGIEQKFILNVGTLEPRKNVISLIEAFARIKKRKKITQKLVICGGRGWYYKNIIARVAQLALGKDIIFTGYVPDEELSLFYRAADVFVYPSLYEGFGLPVLEAMAAGCPVVTSNASSLKEVAGDAGILVDPHSIEDIGQAILDVVCQRELREDLIKKGLIRAKEFSWDKAASDVYTVLTNVISGNTV